jgi:16S rRNA (uracil1498-N3)-methyltransferase
MADRFYTSEVLGLGEHTLEGPEAHHLSHVRRLGPGDPVTLFNGDGFEYWAEVLSCHKKHATLIINSIHEVRNESPFSLAVASALPKGDRADFLIEKLTELGVSRFIPLLTQRSVVRPRESVVEKFERAVIEASKQCGRNRLMVIERPETWDRFLSRSDLPAQRYVCHTQPGGERPVGAADGAVVAVGPEGGFTPGEVKAAMMKGWQACSLGPRVLRVETAALAAAAMIGGGWANSSTT